ncbi:MAG: hypothetical protein ABSH20_10815 [Tepidisphaeraceae bacterium]|jgi:hypothetical protein
MSDLNDIATALDTGHTRQTGQCRCHPRVRSAGPFCPRCGGQVAKRLLTPTAFAWTVGGIAASLALFVGMMIGGSHIPADAPGRLADLQAQLGELQDQNATLSARLTQSESRLAATISAEDTMSTRLATAQSALAQEQGRTAALSRDLTAAKTAAQNSGAVRSQLSQAEKDKAEARDLRNQLGQTEALMVKERTAFATERDKLAAELAAAVPRATASRSGTNTPTTRPAGKPVSEPKLADGRALVAEASVRYCKLIEDIRASNSTTLQKERDLSAARKQFDDSLTQGPVRFTSTVSDVVMREQAIVVQWQAIASDPGGRTTVVPTGPIRITGTAEDASKITKNSKVTLTGVLAASDQQQGRSPKAFGKVHVFLVNGSDYVEFPIVFQDWPVVEIDGVKRKLVEQ